MKMKSSFEYRIFYVNLKQSNARLDKCTKNVPIVVIEVVAIWNQFQKPAEPNVWKVVVAQKDKHLTTTTNAFQLQCVRAHTKVSLLTLATKKFDQERNTWIYGKFLTVN